MSSTAAAGPRSAPAVLGRALHSRLNSLIHSHCSMSLRRYQTASPGTSTSAIFQRYHSGRSTTPHPQRSNPHSGTPAARSASARLPLRAPSPAVSSLGGFRIAGPGFGAGVAARRGGRAGIRKPYMSANLSRPFRTAQVVSFCSTPPELILPSRPAVSQGRRAQGQSRMAVALIVPRAARFPGHCLTGPSTTAGSGASGLAVRRTCPSGARDIPA